MPELKACLEKDGLQSVQTYIQSGNVLFSSSRASSRELSERIRKCILDRFGVDAGVAVLDAEAYRSVIEAAPAHWGADASWKHNLLVLIDSNDLEEVMAAIGSPLTEFERVTAGESVIYQSLSVEPYSKAVSGKLPGKAACRKVTVRNYNTSVKLLELLRIAPEPVEPST